MSGSFIKLCGASWITPLALKCGAIIQDRKEDVDASESVVPRLASLAPSGNLCVLEPKNKLHEIRDSGVGGNNIRFGKATGDSDSC